MVIRSHSDAIALDRAPENRWIDRDGHLHVPESNISKACVNPYRGDEIPGHEELGLSPSRIYHLFRDPEELKKGAASFNGKPLLKSHKPQTAEEHSHGLTVGAVYNVRFEKPYLKAELVVWPKAAIDDIEAERKHELSPGYHYTPVMRAGTFEGQAYDGVMTNIVGNHVTLVKNGRTGSDVVVGDAALTRESLMAARQSTRAKVVRGALTAYLRPKLAQDANMPDLRPVLLGTTAKNWPTAKSTIMARLSDASRGKLAQDATLEDLGKMLDTFDCEGMDDDMEDMSGMDETEEERVAREKKEAEARAAATDDDETPEEKAERMKRRAEARDRAARDTETEAARTERERLEDEARKRMEKEARDKAARDMEPKLITKAAMDEALAVQARSIRAQIMAEQQHLAEAQEIVRPVIGAVMAQDSAEAVYRLLFAAENVDVAGVHPSAYKALAKQTVRASAQAKSHAASNPRVAMDAASTKSFFERFPEAARIRVG